METRNKADWINLPPDVEADSLWPCLHDGELISCRSDKAGEKLTLEFNVKHLLKAGEEDVRFLFNFGGVSSVRATLNTREPKEEPTESDPYAWREESISWDDFEKYMATDPLDVSNADIVFADDSVALHVEGMLNGDLFDSIHCQAFIRGNSMTVSRSDSKEFSLEMLKQLGRDYWDNFGKGR